MMEVCMHIPAMLQEQKGRMRGLGLARWRQLGKASPGKCYSEIHSWIGKESMRYIQTVLNPHLRKEKLMNVKLRQGYHCPLSLTPPYRKVRQWLWNQRNKGTRPLIPVIKRELVQGNLNMYWELKHIKELFILLGVIWWLCVFLTSFFSVGDAELIHGSSPPTIGLQWEWDGAAGSGDKIIQESNHQEFNKNHLFSTFMYVWHFPWWNL